VSEPKKHRFSFAVTWSNLFYIEIIIAAHGTCVYSMKGCENEERRLGCTVYECGKCNTMVSRAVREHIILPR